MRIARSADGNVTIIELLGHMTIDNGDRRVLQAVTEELEGESKAILIDLSNVTYIDSAGIGALVGCKRLCDQRDAEIRLSIVDNSKLLNSLGISPLIVYYSMFTNRSEAISDLENGLLQT